MGLLSTVETESVEDMRSSPLNTRAYESRMSVEVRFFEGADGVAPHGQDEDAAAVWSRSALL